MITDIAAELTNTKERLQEVLSLFKQDQFNKAPFPDSWTAGQVAQHVFKSIEHAPGLLNGGNKPTVRDPAQNVPMLRALFLDFSTKLKSPDFILPDDAPKDLSALAKALNETMEAIIALTKTVDLTLTLTEFEFPGAGETTRLEFVNFISVHTQRHIHQLQNILQAV